MALEKCCPSIRSFLRSLVSTIRSLLRLIKGSGRDREGEGEGKIERGVWINFSLSLSLSLSLFLSLSLSSINFDQRSTARGGDCQAPATARWETALYNRMRVVRAYCTYFVLSPYISCAQHFFPWQASTFTSSHGRCALTYYFTFMRRIERTLWSLSLIISLLIKCKSYEMDD